MKKIDFSNQVQAHQAVHLQTCISGTLESESCTGNGPIGCWYRPFQSVLWLVRRPDFRLTVQLLIFARREGSNIRPIYQTFLSFLITTIPRNITASVASSFDGLVSAGGFSKASSLRRQRPWQSTESKSRFKILWQ